MKRWLLAQTIVVLLVLIFGLYCKSSYIDKGIMSIRTLQDVEQLNCNINQLYEDALIDDVGGNVSDNIKYELSTTENIFVVEPTNNLRQYSFSMTQEVVVKQVINGNAKSGDVIELVSSGGIYDNIFAAVETQNERPVYIGIINLLQPDNEYLVFVNSLEINEYTKIKRYRIESPLLNVLNLNSDYSVPINKPISEISLNDFDGSEFLCDSQDNIDRLIKIKHKIIEDYLTLQ